MAPRATPFSTAPGVRRVPAIAGTEAVPVDLATGGASRTAERPSGAGGTSAVSSSPSVDFPSVAADAPVIGDTPRIADAVGSAGRRLGRRFSFIAANPKLRGLWIGRTTSVIGDRMFAVGTVWIAWTLTHSSAGVACVILAESVPFMVWGLLQRHTTLRKKQVRIEALVGLDLFRSVLLVALYFLHLTSPATKALAVLLVASVAFSTAVFEPAFRSLIPELVPDRGRLAYASFDLGGRLARIAGPLLAAGITWLGSPSLLILADAATFLVSAIFLSRLANPAGAPTRDSEQTFAGIGGLSRPSNLLLRANGLGTFTLIVWWLALPIAAAHHPHGATTYGLCMGMSAGGGIVANLLLSRSPDRHEPINLCTVGWAVVGLCIAALAFDPNPPALLGISALCGAALCVAALGFSFHAANLEMPLRTQLFQRDQVIVRTAGASGAAASGLMLEYRPHLVIWAAALLLLVIAAWIRLSVPRDAVADRRPA